MPYYTVLFQMCPTCRYLGAYHLHPLCRQKERSYTQGQGNVFSLASRLEPKDSYFMTSIQDRCLYPEMFYFMRMCFHSLTPTLSHPLPSKYPCLISQILPNLHLLTFPLNLYLITIILNMHLIYTTLPHLTNLNLIHLHLITMTFQLTNLLPRLNLKLNNHHNHHWQEHP